MKRYLVITSTTIVRAHAATGVTAEQAVEAGAAGERRRLEAYLYDHSTLVAVVHEVQPLVDGLHRITQRALVTVQGNDAVDARYLADYQAGRLQSGSFGVIDYVEDELAAREHVGLVEEPVAPSNFDERVLEALQYAVDVLQREEVEYSLGLDPEQLGAFTTVTENGVERPYTEDDLKKDILRHEVLVNTLADLLAERRDA